MYITVFVCRIKLNTASTESINSDEASVLYSLVLLRVNVWTKSCLGPACVQIQSVTVMTRRLILTLKVKKAGHVTCPDAWWIVEAVLASMASDPPETCQTLRKVLFSLQMNKRGKKNQPKNRFRLEKKQHTFT